MIFSLLPACIYVLCPMLTYILIVVTRHPSRRSYRVALGCYTVVAAVAVVEALCVPVMSIGMFAGFGMGLLWVGLLVLVVLAVLANFLYLLLCLYPFMPERAARIGKGMAYVYTGLLIVSATASSVLAVWQAFYASQFAGFISWHFPAIEFQSPLTHAVFLALLHLVLWLRMHDLKKAVVNVKVNG